jgi:hypothetical protein
VIAQLDRNFIAASRRRSLARLVSYALFEGRPATTRGRWVNPLVLGHLRLAARLPLENRVHRPIFVLGMGRSGTTLLGRILAVHPAVGFLNEPKALWHTIFPGEDLIGSYTSAAASLHLGADDVSDDMKVDAHRVLSWYLSLTCSARLVDKYPELLFRTAFVRAIFPDAVFLVITRRGWDTIMSVQHWSADHTSGDADWWGVGSRKWRILWEQAVLADAENRPLADTVDGSTSNQAVRAAVEWVVTMRQVLRVRDEVTEGLDIIAYEDLAADPVGVTEAILDRCGLEPEGKVLDFAAKAVHEPRPRTISVPDLSAGLAAAVDETTAQLGYV